MLDGDPAGRHEPDLRQLVERRAARQIELVEALGGEDARAVHGIADAAVLLADQRAHALFGRDAPP